MTNASMQAENSIFLSVATAYVDNSGTYYEILSGTSTVWSRLKVVGEGYFLQSSLPEYTLPTAGNKFGLAIDSTGKVVFESPANLSASIKYTQSITGNATATSFAVTHNKATKDVVVQVFDVDTDDEVDVSISRSTLDVVEVIFAAAPATGKQYRVVVI